MDRGAGLLGWGVGLALSVGLVWLVAGDRASGGPGPLLPVGAPASGAPAIARGVPTEPARARVEAPVAVDALRDRVRAEGGLVGVVRGRDGLPVPRALVWLLDEDLERRLGFARADVQGRFAFGRGEEIADAPETAAIAAHHAAHGFAEPMPVTIPGAGHVESIDVSLDGHDQRIEGTVRGPAGDPFPDFPVALVWLDGPSPNDPDWKVGGADADLRTDAEGRFSALGMRPGRYELEYEPDTIPLGFVEAPPDALVEIDTGTRPFRLDVASVRVDFDVFDGGETPQVADRIAFRVFAPQDADRIEASYPGEEPVPTVGEFDQRQSIGETASTAIFAAPGALVFAAASRGGRVVERRYRVASAPARQRVVLDLAAVPEGGTRVRLDVRRAAGGRPEQALVRARRPDGLLAAPIGLEDVGSGFCALPESGEIRLPPGPVQVDVLGDGFDVGRAWYETDSRMVSFELDVPPAPGRIDRVVELDVAAYLEIEVVADAGTPNAAARAAWLPPTPETGGVPLLRTYASAESDELGETALRLAWIGPDGGWNPARGVPHEPGRTVTLRPLGAFAPGSIRFAMQSWRPATADDARGRLVPLRPGRNVLRYRLGLDGVLYPLAQ
jgi:hypothetical protein